MNLDDFIVQHWFTYRDGDMVMLSHTPCMDKNDVAVWTDSTPTMSDMIALAALHSCGDKCQDISE